MTIEKRARKIADELGINPNWGREKSIEYYVAHLREVEREGHRRGVLDQQVIESQVVKVAQKAMFEHTRDKAAGMVTGLDHCDLNGHSCTKEIAERIRALKRPAHNSGPEHFCNDCAFLKLP